MIKDNDYRKYFDTTMLDDALLKTYVTPNIVREASGFVENTAKNFGVSASSIKVPTPFAVEQLARLYAYMTAAFRKATFSVGKDADEDSFALKYKIYKQLLDEWLEQMSAESFTGGAMAKKRKFPSTIPVYRN